MYFYRARYYDSITGRFINEDPIGFAGGDFNLYRYVQNNPVNLIDPEGLKSPLKKLFDIFTGAKRVGEDAGSECKKRFKDGCGKVSKLEICKDLLTEFKKENPDFIALNTFLLNCQEACEKKPKKNE